MGYFNLKWQVYSANATRRTYDLNTDKGEVGGSSPPRPTIQVRGPAAQTARWARRPDQSIQGRFTGLKLSAVNIGR